MTAKELLDRNGDFTHSPLLETARKLHKLLSDSNAAYVIVGGLSVIRNGGMRTTRDVDVLVRKEEWSLIQKDLSADFTLEAESAVDRTTNIAVDILFAGDDGDMLVPLPDPEEVREYDSDLKANFLTLAGILELKTATYLQKKRDEGIEIAAKDLADVVELLRTNRGRISSELWKGIHPRIGKELRRIQKKVSRGSGGSW